MIICDISHKVKNAFNKISVWGSFFFFFFPGDGEDVTHFESNDWEVGAFAGKCFSGT